jgi:hypothetical protein
VKTLGGAFLARNEQTVLRFLVGQPFGITLRVQIEVKLIVLRVVGLELEQFSELTVGSEYEQAVSSALNALIVTFAGKFPFGGDLTGFEIDQIESPMLVLNRRQVKFVENGQTRDLLEVMVEDEGRVGV